MNIKELRAKYNMTQTALAKELGVSSNAISAIESGRLKLSNRLASRIGELYGEAVKQEKAAEKKVKSAEKKVKSAEKNVKSAEKKVRTAKKVKAASEKLETAGEVAVVAAAVKKTRKAAAKKAAPRLVIQSPYGLEITPDEVFAKTGEVDAVYVRVDENKAYWVKGDEVGAVDLW